MLLLFGVIVGLAGQPVQAMSAAVMTVSTAMTGDKAMSSMDDCMAAASKKTTPCKCGMAGCLAMMASGAPLLFVHGPMAPPVVASSERLEGSGVVAPLHGRVIAPEPEPPTVFA
ncbi:MAG: hypothetical protein ABIS14_10580 [Sphingomonas sp.]